MNNSELFLLSLINQAPRYGYEIAQFLEESNAGLWLNLSMPYVYRILKSFEAKGWVHSRLVESDRNRPNKNIYELTESGRSALAETLAEADYSDDKIYFGMDVALAVYTITGRSFDLPALIRNRIKQVTEELNQFTANDTQADLTADETMARLIIEHRISFLRAEVEWLGKVQNILDGIS